LAPLAKLCTAVRPAFERWIWAIASLWLIAAAAGLWVVWAWDNSPGLHGNAPTQWPTASALSRATDRPTLILLAHPQCSCTQASLGELAEVLARAQTRPTTYVVFLKPLEFAAGWEQGDLWSTATAIPGVTVLRDDEGREAQRFGAATSGQTLLYDAGGTLVFSGGVTGARAHRGDNAGRATLVSLLNGGLSADVNSGLHREPGHNTTNVFGCPLFAPGS
jgi:hypothetical protein